MITLDLRPNLPLTDQAFDQLCRSNPDLRLERTAQGELIAMAPSGSETGYYNADISGQLWGSALNLWIDRSLTDKLTTIQKIDPQVDNITQPNLFISKASIAF
jgi:Uma2 family endonuclease